MEPVVIRFGGAEIELSLAKLLAIVTDPETRVIDVQAYGSQAHLFLIKQGKSQAIEVRARADAEALLKRFSEPRVSELADELMGAWNWDGDPREAVLEYVNDLQRRAGEVEADDEAT